MPARTSSLQPGPRDRARGPRRVAAWLAVLLAALFVGCGLSTVGTGEPAGQACSEDAHCDDGNPCTIGACGPAGLCDVVPAPDGDLAEQIAGDCHTDTCVAGVLTPVVNQADVNDDGNDCTFDTCPDGEVRNTPKPNGEVCFQGEAQGSCQSGACVVVCGEDLPPCDDDEPCTTDACDVAAGQCVFSPLHGEPPPGSVEPPGDCGVLLCIDGAGVKIADASDTPQAATDCYFELCNGTQPETPPRPLGDACDTAGGRVCDGAGVCVACNVPADCVDLPVDGECGTRTCVAHVCGQTFTPVGTPLADQGPPDCKRLVCNGAGGVSQVNDDTDVVSDGSACTTDTCSAGSPVHTPLQQGTSCGAGAEVVCDANGNCVGCNMASDCPPGNTCASPTCVSQTCGISNAAADTPCNEGGGTYCNGAGACVQCNAASQCPAPPVCVASTCASGQCGTMNISAGTALPPAQQVAGDCKRIECNGAGATQIVADAMDLPPDDGNQCTISSCSGMDPVHLPAGFGTTCSQAGGQQCDGAGACKKVPGQLCAAGMECLTGQCTDGVCCDTACGAACFACDLPGLAGTCSPVASGQQDVCAAGSVCNGTGACRKVDGQTCAAGVECLNGHCVDGVCCNASCGAACFACDLAGSVGACTPVALGVQDVCGAGSVCNGAGACRTLNGQVCGAGGECLSGECYDGVCCNMECSAVCRSCNLPGNAGNCLPVPAGQPDLCPGGSVCDAVGVCKKSNGQTCAAGGECLTGQCVDGFCCDTSCGAVCFACDVPGVQGTCSPVAQGSPDACAPSMSCNAIGECKGNVGQACVANGDCANGQCVDGFCCDSACGGACDRCDLSGMEGVCTLLPVNDPGMCGMGQLCDAAGVCKSVVGQACMGNGDCLNDRCVDGYCCDSACAGNCDVCNLAGMLGQCTQVPANDPGTCASGQLCDAGGACKSVVGQACPGGNGDCLNNQCVDGYCCDSACGGDCDACNISGMLGQCTPLPASDPGACTMGQLCDGAGVCKSVVGQACPGGNGDCLNGQCVDGYCCNAACGGDCDACDLSGMEGMCASVPVNDPGTCAMGQLCDGAGVCKSVVGQACIGNGDCLNNQCVDGYCCGSACAGDCDACNVAGMEGMCTQVPANDPGTCMMGQLCDAGGVCKSVVGQACGGSGDCLNNRCVDGYCCETACTEDCHACDLSGSVGLCEPVPQFEPDTCGADMECNDIGLCKLAAGQPCVDPADCASNMCDVDTCL